MEAGVKKAGGEESGGCGPDRKTVQARSTAGQAKEGDWIMQMQDQRELFKQEACELLSELESSLLELELNPGDMEIIGRVFRALHTIKGSGAMFGFDSIAAFTHEIENAFDKVRSGLLPVTKGLVDLTLSAGDMIRSMLDDPSGREAREQAGAQTILDSIRKLVPGGAPSFPQAEPVEEGTAPSAGAKGSLTYHIQFAPNPDIFLKGTNPLLLLNELRGLGECTVFGHTDRAPGFDELNPEECFTRWDIVLTTDKGTDAVRDVFIFVEDDCRLEIEAIEDLCSIEDEDKPGTRIGEILIERGCIRREELERVLFGRKKTGELLLDAGLVEASRIEYALAEQQHIRQVRQKHKRSESASNIRVPTEKLDILVDLVGELVTVQARLSQTVASKNYSQLLSVTEEVERLTAELRDNTMGIRMLPIATTFNNFKRLVRDLSNELGKEIVLVTEGGETELDKTVIERLTDPLIHLIRNSIDHGIEAPETRRAAGKPSRGTVHIAASHSGASVQIKIFDDGAGLDKDAIRVRAVSKGLIAPDAVLAEKDLFALIFVPGFSTARSVTNISGRGVGMDVVKKSIDSLRGSIEIGSKKGQGTTITLKLPLTLAIIDGLLVEVDKTRFVLPLSIVEECTELKRRDSENGNGRKLAFVRDKIVPYIDLRQELGMEGKAPEIEQMVILDESAGKVGFVVDKVIGEHQTVIKSLGRACRDVEGISGATILGDGSVALILDAPKLVGMVEREATAG